MTNNYGPKKCSNCDEIYDAGLLACPVCGYNARLKMWGSLIAMLLMGLLHYAL